MKSVISIIQIILGILLVLIIIIQQKGSGLGTSFGGDMSFYRTKRGAEKLLFYGTIGISVAFIIFSLIGLLV
ncbi:preprotein translocase subunit SecG [Candidatus Daviesbacteria bacterium RIFCSPLOWO2_02_FULL_41_8]|uniref:Protein-export membrane protein SecG n=3 Tax=Candidatus Daviesiibacteriota TaxID=1752718 RepID=A0A1F5NLQ2_9BACT|nr:MAG: preprotein translocase subunit SecG [Candidatus Daviesbacteria bacterium RIFCSPHIGHO2_01_FULL_41_23]OGE33647.1 MAG: preprotein translocase subunit SecG [Candidatus Daviesbacteria bacterium RIFCSPHIGHO2_02_FULL_41_10]OGE61900.1 MAG: preprotein translocase subunit SecG [Candidatus Daviesbacteria bacterium RIFCSPLOWO2_01_FULL_41_32]OGE78646.1 MAG: preprotein translocase subunit SecG [Candidatus Daviesbacteria bacterium RIFCSPLOWO2_02_FULL_41_8]